MTDSAAVRYTPDGRNLTHKNLVVKISLNRDWIEFKSLQFILVGLVRLLSLPKNTSHPDGRAFVAVASAVAAFTPYNCLAVVLGDGSSSKDDFESFVIIVSMTARR